MGDPTFDVETHDNVSISSPPFVAHVYDPPNPIPNAGSLARGGGGVVRAALSGLCGLRNHGIIVMH